MGWVSDAKANSKATNSHPLVTCAQARPIPAQVAEAKAKILAGLWAMKPNWEVLGTCGHRLAVYAAHDAFRAEALVNNAKRKRCTDCPKNS